VLGVWLDEEAGSHIFGGPPLHRGTVPPGCRRSMHLLFQLDLSDEDISLRLPGVSKLPLYYPFFHCGKVGYRVVSDKEISVLTRGHWERDSADPAPDIPAQLPHRYALVADSGFDLFEPESAFLRLASGPSGTCPGDSSRSCGRRWRSATAN
jgi:hypothetical protein